MVASVAGMLDEGRISQARPFRSPHHSASMAALTGEGCRCVRVRSASRILRVLFLDELPEFQRAVLDLRQPRRRLARSMSRRPMPCHPIQRGFS